jgi:hypothetical protein
VAHGTIKRIGGELLGSHDRLFSIVQALLCFVWSTWWSLPVATVFVTFMICLQWWFMKGCAITSATEPYLLPSPRPPPAWDSSFHRNIFIAALKLQWWFIKGRSLAPAAEPTSIPLPRPPPAWGSTQESISPIVILSRILWQLMASQRERAHLWLQREHLLLSLFQRELYKLNVLMNIQTPLPTSLAEIRPLNMVSSIYWLVSSNYWRLQLMGLATQSTVCERECRSSSMWLSWSCMRCANVDCF